MTKGETGKRLMFEYNKREKNHGIITPPPHFMLFVDNVVKCKR